MEKNWQELRLKIYQKLDMSREIEDEELLQLIQRELRIYARSEMLSLSERADLEQRLYNSFRKMDILQELIEDEAVTEILVNGPYHIFYEKGGMLYQWDKVFISQERLETIIQNIVGKANKIVNESEPIVDTRLEDGSRVNVVLPPVSLVGPCISIRKFSKEQMTLERLVKLDSMSSEIAEFLKIMVRAGYNIFISGGTGSGKTTVLNALSESIPKDQRVITIEDSAELQLHSVPNLVQLETRCENRNGVDAITIRDLIKSALRMRPDRIIVGEVRGAEALDMLQAINTGHDGSLSTGHANSAVDMLRRLETMVLMGMDLPISAIRGQIAYGIDILVHLGRMRDKSRKLLTVYEVLGLKDGEVEISPLYCFQEGRYEAEKVEGSWVARERLQNREKLERAGLQEQLEKLERTAV